jgi:hypothetical protein
VPALGQPVRVAVVAVRRVAAAVPHEVDRGAVERLQHHARPAAPRRAVVADRAPVDAGQVHARLLEQRVEPWRVRALGQPEAAGPVLEALTV